MRAAEMRAQLMHHECRIRLHALDGGDQYLAYMRGQIMQAGSEQQAFLEIGAGQAALDGKAGQLGITRFHAHQADVAEVQFVITHHRLFIGM